MVMGKRKGSLTGVEVTTNKGPMKQKTLFDSFLVKSVSKIDNPEGELARDDIALPSSAEEREARSESFDPTRLPPAINGIPHSDSGTCVDLSCDDNANLGQHPVDKIDPVTWRSPSISIMEDDQVTDITIGNAVVERERTDRAEGHSEDNPIIINSSPMKGAPMTSKPIHPFFTPKLKNSTPPNQPHLSRAKSKGITVIEAAPYPTGISQHVRGPQTSFQMTGTQISRRAAREAHGMIEESASYKFLKQDDSMVNSTVEPSKYQTRDTPKEPPSYDIPVEHTSSHPAIARLVRGEYEDPPMSRRPWSEKWRPLSAQEVLGNERSASYLRNWLRALELEWETQAGPSFSGGEQESNDAKQQPKAATRGTKRPRIVRAVTKSRKRSRVDSEEEEDDWIVDDDESEPEVAWSEDKEDIIPDIPANMQSSGAPDVSLLVTAEEDTLGQLHNTILLSGPSGSGKTACVYACAEELGWDVFEVYPGIGRRNGANVDNLIGEVGKNHLVIQNRTSGDGLKSFLSQKKATSASGDLTTKPSSDEVLLLYSPRKRPQSKDTSEPGDPANCARPIRQSLILLEEVDILYKEDTHFWTTVTRIIKDCKRPVICTCNDISLVPIGDLPLQSILEFSPCPADVATSYLQALCSAEGFSIDREIICQLYEGRLMSERRVERMALSRAPDLRRTINELQMRCPTLNRTHGQSHGDGIKGDGQEDGCAKEDRLSMRRYESMSYLDSNLDGEAWRAFKVRVHLEMDGTRTESQQDAELGSGREASEDDEVGHSILYDEYAPDRAPWGEYERQEEMVRSAMAMGCGLSDTAGEEERAEEGGGGVVAEVLGESGRRRGCAEERLEYLPYLRQMVAAEDAEEARWEGVRRRKSSRSGYVRVLRIGEGGRKKLEW